MEAKKPKSILVLLDMNETLIFRKRKIISCDKPPDITSSKHVYFRPGVYDFLSKLMSHPNIEVAIYSTMIMKNIKISVDFWLKDERLAPLKHRLTKLFDKSYNVRDPDEVKKTATMRDLKKIWKSKICGKLYDAKNTIIIDNEIRKVRNCLENAIVVDSFVENHLVDKKPNNVYYLNALADYILKIVGEFKGDVRKHLKETPFKIDQKLYETVDPYLAAFSSKKEHNGVIGITTGIEKMTLPN